MFPFPPEPDVPEGQQASGEVGTRYEDIAQDGRVKVSALPHALGDVCWMKLLRRHPIARMTRTDGVVPILSRLVIEGGGGPVSVRRSLEARGTYQLAHTRDPAGEVDRLILNLWVDVHGVVGCTHGPPPANAGEPIRVGRVFAEHVFTRPFAERSERKVRSLEGFEGVPAVPPDRYEWRSGTELLTVPEDADPIDSDAALDGLVTVFGLSHTDSNQHVNSLEHPRLFEEAALRRLLQHGHGVDRLARFVEIVYRKPCFAGDRVRVRLHTFARGGTAGAVGTIVPATDPAARPYCYARLAF